MALSVIATTLVALIALATPPACESSVLLGGSSPNQWTVTGRSSEPVTGAAASPTPVEQQSNATSAAGANSYAANVLEAISSVGNAIRQQIGAADQVQIITSPAGAAGGAGGVASQQTGNSKQNEYQSVGLMSPAVSTGAGAAAGAGVGAGTSANQSSLMAGISIKEQGEMLRQEIVRRAGQLQQVVASSLDLLKNNGDLIVRRLLEQLNTRLDVAKAKAERILSEPATNEAALRALAAVNQGLNNLNNIIGNIVARLDLSANQTANNNSTGARADQSSANQLTFQQQLSQSAASALSLINGNNGIKERFAGVQSAAAPQQQPQPNQQQQPGLLDANRLRANLQQISQQFSAALNTTQLQQVLSPLRQRTSAIASAQPAPASAPLSRSSLMAKLEALRQQRINQQQLQQNLQSQSATNQLQPTVRAN